MKILIADDDPITLDSLKVCLESEGYTPLTARDGKEALSVWQEQKPDLLCLDIMMPAVDGYEVCRKVRSTDARIPVLFLSAKSEEIDVVVGLQLGADDFIRKPFGKHELLARIRTALRRTHAQSEPEKSFRFHEWTVYPLELRAVSGTREVELSPREISILSLLHDHPGEVIDRDTLLNRCWGIDYFPESRTLDVHIGKLRRKIERDPADPTMIETIRGVGYRYRRPE